MIFIFKILISLSAFGACYIEPDLNTAGSFKAEKRSKPTSNYICEIPCDGSISSDYDISGNSCTLNSSRKNARLALVAQKKSQDNSKKSKIKSDWESLCSNPSPGLESILCEERGF